MNDGIKKAHQNGEIICIGLVDDPTDEYLVGIIEKCDEYGIVLRNIDYRGVETAYMYLSADKISGILDMPFYLEKIRILFMKHEECKVKLDFPNEGDVKRAFVEWIYNRKRQIRIRLEDEELTGYISCISDFAVHIGCIDARTGEKDGHMLLSLSHMDYFSVRLRS